MKQEHHIIIMTNNLPRKRLNIGAIVIYPREILNLRCRSPIYIVDNLFLRFQHETRTFYYKAFVDVLHELKLCV